MPPPPDEASTPAVRVYTVPQCPHCQAVKSFLMERHVEFIEIDVSENPGALWHLLGVAGRARVPVVWARRQMVIGFDAHRIDELLAALKEPEEVEPDLSGPIGRRDGRETPADGGDGPSGA